MKIKHLKKLVLLGITVLWLSLLAIPARAEWNIRFWIPLPPPIVFSAPPQVVVLPQTYVYVVPDIQDDFFFYDGFWWRPWRGRWYRSQYYDRGWGYYSSVPIFYREVPQYWRRDYRDHRWNGQPWNYERVHYDQVQRNWKGWKQDKYWEKHNTWGVQGMKPQQHEGQQPQPHAQQPQGQKQQPSQPNKSQANQGPGNQGQGNQGPGNQNQGNQGHVNQGQGNKDQGQGNKAGEPQGGPSKDKDNKDKDNKNNSDKDKEKH